MTDFDVSFLKTYLFSLKLVLFKNNHEKVSPWHRLPKEGAAHRKVRLAFEA